MSTRADTPTKDRLVQATARLLAEQGPSGTGTAQILSAASAPRGSFYFHFPAGKDELVQAAVRYAGQQTADKIIEVFDADTDLPDRMEQYFTLIAEEVTAGGYLLGCAIGATTLDLAATSPQMRATTSEVFTAWIDAVTDYLEHSGVDSSQARTLGYTFVAAIEGATMLARALHDDAPLRAAGRTMHAATTALLQNARHSTAKVVR